MGNATTVPGIPDVPASADAETKRFLQALKEAVEVRLGRRGDKLDAAITFRDVDNSPQTLVGVRSTRTGAVLVDGTADATPPPTPTGFSATAGLTTNILTWDAPSTAFENYAYTEVWRAAADNLAAAVMVGMTTASVYADAVGDTAVERWYWIRHVSTSNVAGPYNAVGGTHDITLKVLTNHIDDFAVTNAKIGNLAVDNAKIASLDAAKINTGYLNADRIQASSITAAKLSVTSLDAVSADLGNITGGTITLNATGHIKGGQSAFNTGTGYWLGYSGGVYKFSIGNPSGNYLAFDGSALSYSGNIATASSQSAQFLGSFTAYWGSAGVVVNADGSGNAGSATFGGIGATGAASGAGLLGVALAGTGSMGVQGTTANAGSYGVYAKNGGGGTALYADGLTKTGDVDPTSDGTKYLGNGAWYLGVMAYYHYGIGFVMNNASSASYNDTTTRGMITHTATHNLAASKYVGGAVPTNGTGPFEYHNIGGKVALFIDSTGGVYTQSTW